jgi:hypothetical protein
MNINFLAQLCESAGKYENAFISVFGMIKIAEVIYR